MWAHMGPNPDRAPTRTGPQPGPGHVESVKTFQDVERCCQQLLGCPLISDSHLEPGCGYIFEEFLATVRVAVQILCKTGTLNKAS